MTEFEILEKERNLTPEQLFQLLTPENKAAVNRQIDLLVASQSTDR